MCTSLLDGCVLGFVLGLGWFLGFVLLLLWLWIGFFNMVVVVWKEVVDCCSIGCECEIQKVTGFWGFGWVFGKV